MRIVIYSRGLQRGKSPSEVVNIAASKKMNSCAGDDLTKSICCWNAFLATYTFVSVL